MAPHNLWRSLRGSGSFAVRVCAYLKGGQEVHQFVGARKCNEEGKQCFVRACEIISSIGV